MGHSQSNISPSIQNELTFKTVILLALTRPSRSVDLANLTGNNYSPEGVTFALTKLAKQSTQSKPVTEIFFPYFQLGDNYVCPLTTLQAYEDRTKEREGLSAIKAMFYMKSCCFLIRFGGSYICHPMD